MVMLTFDKGDKVYLCVHAKKEKLIYRDFIKCSPRLVQKNCNFENVSKMILMLLFDVYIKNDLFFL